MKFQILLPAMFLAACAPAKQDSAADGAGHGAMQHAAATSTSAGKAFGAVADGMYKDMAVVLTGDADTDFMRSMVPHHEGAVAMAKVVLEHGRGPEVRALAQSVIAAQEKEIAVILNWLERRDQAGRPSPGTAN